MYRIVQVISHDQLGQRYHKQGSRKLIYQKPQIKRYFKKVDLCQILIKGILKIVISMYSTYNDEHIIDLDELVQRLDTDLSNGLSKNAVDNKMREFGENVLSEKKTIPGYSQLIIFYQSQFGNFLLLASILCFVAYGLTPTYRLNLLDKYVPHSLSDSSNLGLGIVLFFLQFIIGTFTYFQNKKFEALTQNGKNLIPPEAIVIRDGNQMRIRSSELVPGDIVVIEKGKAILADVRIIDSQGMKVDDSNLTGTSLPMIKSIQCTSQDPLETKNMALFGTFCKEGCGKGLVVNTGDRTIMGRLNKSHDPLSQIEPNDSAYKHFREVTSKIDFSTYQSLKKNDIQKQQLFIIRR